MLSRPATAWLLVKPADCMLFRVRSRCAADKARHCHPRDAEQRIAELCARHGVSQAEIDQAQSVGQPLSSQTEQEDDLYLSTLARYVAALGGHLEVGHLEVQAVFPDETITVLRDGRATRVVIDGADRNDGLLHRTTE
jgi:hypothetical protein